MPINLAPAQEYYAYIRKFSAEDLIPAFVPGVRRSRSEVFKAQLSWFVYDVCTPGTSVHEEYGKQTKILLPRAVFAAAIGQKNNEVAASHLRMLHHDTNGIVRILDQQPIEIPRMTSYEAKRLMCERLRQESEAFLTVHRADAVGDHIQPKAGAASKRQLTHALRYLIAQQRAAASRIGTGCDSEREIRVNAEIIWQADVLLHDVTMEAAGVDEPTNIRDLRRRMRLVGGYKDVILGRLNESIDEHEELANALLTMCNTRRGTEERLAELLSNHLAAAELQLISIIKKNTPFLYSDSPVHATPRLDAICSLAAVE